MRRARDMRLPTVAVSCVRSAPQMLHDLLSGQTRLRSGLGSEVWCMVDSGQSVSEAQGGEIHPEDRLVDLTSHPRREEVAARVRRDRNGRSTVALELQRDPTERSVAFRPR